MKENKITRCHGSNGCLLRESCQRYEPGFPITKNEHLIISQYSVQEGCPNYKTRKIQPIITELIK